MKKQILVLLGIFYFSSAFAQKAIDFKQIEGVELLRQTEHQKYPSYLRLDMEHAFRVEFFSEWLQKTFFLPPGVHFKLLRSESDQIGMTHFRYQQYLFDVPVEGGIYMAHVKDERVVAMNGLILDVSTMEKPKASISGEQSVKRALDYIPSEKYIWEDSPSLHGLPTAELMIVPKGLDFEKKELLLAYKTDIYSLIPLKRAWVYVDAHTGAIVAEWNRICMTDSLGTAMTQYSGQRSITTDLYNGTYRLRESSRGGGIETYNLNHSSDYYNATDFFDPDNVWDNFSIFKDEYARDLHWGLERTYDYFLDVHNKNSFDGQGAKIKGYFHYGNGFGNAFWDGSVVTFGDGDGGQSGINGPAVSLEIVGHEIAHGVTEFSAGLIYSSESGALNESFSDIFGASIDFANRTGAGANWKVGDEVSADGIGFRSLSNPNYFGHPACYQGNYWESFNDVHINSSVQNHWFYLLSVGGTGVNELGTIYSVTGIGYAAAAAIAFRALNTYLTPSSNYNDAAYYSSQAAEDIYGACSVELAQTIEAWHAVGLSPIANSWNISFSAKQYYCHLPATVVFENHSFGLDSILWDFGDGTSSTELYPTHIYTELGNYSVQAIGFGCNDSDTILKTDYIFIDSTSTFCDTTTLDTFGYQLFTHCSGVLLDPGGENDIPPNTDLVFTIIPPGATSVQLDFSSFGIAYGTQIRIYDGATISAPLISAYIPVGGQVISTGGAITVQLKSATYSTGEGFVVSYFANNSGALASAGFVISNSNPPLNAPIEFITTDTMVGVQWIVDDNLPILERDLVYYFTEPGSHTITQIVNNCNSSDTLNQSIVVQSAPELFAYSPTSITSTLNSGDIETQVITIENGNENDLWYRIAKGNESTSFDSTLMYVYTTTGASSFFFFENVNYLDTLFLTVTINGDFGGSYEFASIYINGQFFNDIEDFGLEGVDVVAHFSIYGSTLANMLANHSLEIEIRNTGYVGLLGAGHDIHMVNVRGVGIPFVTLSNEEGVIEGVGSGEVGVEISAAGFIGGVYNVDLALETGDTSQSTITIPVTLNVIDAAKPELLNSPLDFGGIFVGAVKSLALKIENKGSIPFQVFSANSNQAAFVSQNVLTVQSGKIGNLNIVFSPTELGAVTSDIVLTTSTGPITFSVFGAGIEPPIASVDPSFVELTLPTGGGQDVPVTISNTGNSAMYFNMVPAVPFGIDTAVTQYFYSDGDSTEYVFPLHLNSFDTLFLGITVNGDFDDASYEFVSLYIDGEFIQKISGPSGGDIHTSLQFTGTQLGTWVEDGVLDIKMVNSPAVSPYYGDAKHAVAVYSRSLDWITVDGVQDTVLANQSKDRVIHFDATSLFGGDYTQDIVIQTNDPIVPILTVSALLHVEGQAVLFLPDTLIDFGNLYVGTMDTMTISLENTGTDTLHISNISLTQPAFEISNTSLVIAPFSIQKVEIYFAPANAQYYSGELIITSNVASQTIPVIGWGVLPPNIEITPDTMFADLVAGEEVTKNLLIKNTGGSELLRKELRVGSNVIATSIQNYSYSGATTTHVFDGVFSADSMVLTFYISGDYDDVNESASIYIDGDFVVTIDDGNPTNGSVIVAQYTFSGSQLDEWASDGTITIEIKNTIDVDTGIGGTDTHEVRFQTLGDIWLSAQQAGAKVIAAGATDTIPVLMDATGLGGGIYASSITILSNDLAHDSIIVPVYLHVEGQAFITFSLDEVNFGEQFLHESATLELLVENAGTDSLIISDMVTDNDGFTLSSLNDSLLLPGENTIVTVTFLPTEVGGYTGLMIIHSNIADKTIVLSGEGVLPPSMSFSPDTLFASLKPNERITKSLILGNDGGVDLQYSVPAVGFQVVGTAKKHYFYSGAWTEHVFEVPATTERVVLQLMMNGDFDGDPEYADLYIEGNFFAKIEDNNILNGNIIHAEYVLEGDSLAVWLADDKLKVSLHNTDKVNVGFSPDWHQYKIELFDNGWLHVLPTTGSASFAQADTVPVYFTALGLGVGDYYSSIEVASNDQENPSVVVPVHLLVLDPDATKVPIRDESVTIYPNPVSEGFTIDFDASLLIKSVEIVNMLGEVVMRSQIMSRQDQKEIRFVDYPFGNYIVILISDTGRRYYLPFVKQ